MCGMLKVICVLACLLVVPTTPQTQQDRGKGSGARCRKPCFQEILKKLDKNGSGIDELRKEVEEIGRRIEEVDFRLGSLFEDLISEVKKNGQGIDEIKTKVGENGENINFIIDLIEEGKLKYFNKSKSQMSSCSKHTFSIVKSQKLKVILKREESLKIIRLKS